MASRLSAEDVREMRRRNEQGTPMDQLCREYRLHSIVVDNILNRRTWTHV